MIFFGTQTVQGISMGYEPLAPITELAFDGPDCLGYILLWTEMILHYLDGQDHLTSSMLGFA